MTLVSDSSASSRTLIFSVAGVPGPQGSKRYVGHSKKGHAILVESSGKVKGWRDLVHAAALQAMSRSGRWRRGEAGPVRMIVLFTFARPKYHFGTGRNSTVLKPDAPRWHTKYPDESKLLRSTEDALVTAGVVSDDAVFARHDMAKMWANPGEVPGAVIVLTTYLDPEGLPLPRTTPLH